MHCDFTVELFNLLRMLCVLCKMLYPRYYLSHHVHVLYCLPFLIFIFTYVVVHQITVALMDETRDPHGVGRFLEESNPVIQVAMESRSHESSQSPEESVLQNPWSK
jgi:hypothetical protein